MTDIMKTRFFALAALALSLAACTQDEPADDNRLPEGEYPVVIRATGLSVEATPQAAPSTRATVDGDWQGVQTVALKMGDAVKEYTVTATDADGYKSATLSCENDPHYWTSRDPITVSAWWPLDKADITRMPAVKVAEDQSTLAAFQGSDFISAENQTVTFSDPKLTFTHRTARVAIELKPGTGFTSVDGATVSLVSLSTDNENPTAIKTCNTAGDTYEALAAPQTVAAGKPFIQVELGDGTFHFRPKNDVVLEAGSRYTYTVNVNATELTLAGCEIGKWDDGGGESGAAEDLDYTISTDGKNYYVYTAKGLLAWNEAVQKDMSLNCTLAADITLPTVAEGESNWTPVGTYSNPYTGTFDGGGHTITGLTVDLPNQSNVGLIGHLLRGTVRNLTLAGVEINGRGFVGGVVGANDGTVTGCAVSGKVSGNSLYIGGVVGYNANSSTVTGCYATGDVSGNEAVGGVVGDNIGTTTACYHAAGEVSGNSGVGGVAGQCDSGSVTVCYWSNNLDAGIGYISSGSGETTKVDGTTVTWIDAQSGMNAAIDAWNANHSDAPCNWHYAETDAETPPTLEPIND